MAAESQPIQREPLRVTPDQLIDSNQSPFSKERIAAYKSAKDEGKLVLFKLCADARSGPSLFNFDAAAVDRSIAASVSPTEYGDAIRHHGVGAIVIAPHFDGIKSEDQGFFNGCGGQDAFRSMHNHEPNMDGIPDPDVAHYLRQNISSENPFVQAFRLKDQVMRQFLIQGEDHYKPIMLGAIDHRTGLFIPVWFSGRDDRGRYVTTSTLQSHHIQNPEYITPENVLQFDPEELPEIFREVLESNRRFVASRPELKETQRVQNPDVIVVTTALMPLRNRYANLFDTPNTVFVVGAPASANAVGNGELHVTDPGLILDQVSYPVEHAVSAYDVDSPFKDTRTIIFETGAMAESVILADEFVKRPWAQDWLNEGGSMIIAETKSAVTTKAFVLQS
ncbi:hypothetical protein KBC14_04395 [Candidatus Woesebacteria bacterium]|jgi:hypothetical protein|nr:hypothetical protein [Candidatus Woesebacteria bacterium]